MAETFPFKLLTPVAIVFEGDVEQATASNQLGEFSVLPEHINYITSLVPGVLVVKERAGSELLFVISGGLAEVKDGTMTVLATDAQLPEQLDRESALREVSAAEDKLAHLSFYDPEHEKTRRELQLARARQRASGLGA